MSLKKLPALVCTMCIFVLLVACSGESSESSYKGNWSYTYEKKEPALLVKNGGKAKLDGKKFTYTEENGILRLENKAGDLAFAKFKNDGDKRHILLYKHTTYIGVNNDGLIGKWKSGKWTFEFTAEGTFLEDGCFPGYYLVDEENSSIALIYNDQFENTIVPYELKDNKLILDYPWEMVKKIN